LFDSVTNTPKHLDIFIAIKTSYWFVARQLCYAIACNFMERSTGCYSPTSFLLPLH